MAKKGRKKGSRKGRKKKAKVTVEEEEVQEAEPVVEEVEIEMEDDGPEEAQPVTDEEDTVDEAPKKKRTSKKKKGKAVEDAVEEEPEEAEPIVVEEDAEEEEEQIIVVDDTEEEEPEEVEPVIVEEDTDEEEEQLILEEEIEEEEPEVVEPAIVEEDTDEEEEGEDVWNAVQWDDVGPSTSKGDEVVFAEASVKDILKDLVDQAWDDGIITDDEMAMLNVLKKKLNLDEDSFQKIMEGSRPVPEVEEEEEEDEEEEEEDVPDEPEPEEEELLEPEPIEEEPAMKEELSPLMDELPKPPSPPAPPGKGIITLTTSVRGSKQPLGESFDLTQKQDESFKKRCPHCRSMIRVNPGQGKNACPICGKQLVEKKQDSPALRKILDQAKSAFKEGDKNTAKELYAIALAQSPGNKEAMFYLQKMQHRKGATTSTVDARTVSIITTESPRLDQLMKGGIQVGYQVLLKGPAFCGKEVLLDKIMASTLRKGLPVIYVSSNRAMKEVMQGIIRQAPDFKSFNQKGLVRMYDLFSKYSDGRVLKEGHRIFNIEDREDFKKFQEDIVIILDELYRDYHGGLMIMNSLSPLITQTDQNDLMKFMQVLIARSKSYRFTNVLDLAAGVHSESVENSVEYLMDGIIEFKEQDNKNQLRLKGFRNSALTKDWVDYQHDDSSVNIVGSFMEERIL